MPDGTLAEIAFCVTDAARGSPVADAEAWVFLTEAGGVRTRLLSGRTDADGRCVIRADMHGDATVRLIPIVRAAGYQEWRTVYDDASRVESCGRRAQWPEIAPGGMQRFDVPLSRGRTIAGRILSSDGKPLAGATIDLILAGANWYSWPHSFGAGRTGSWPPPCVTDDDGWFEWLSFPAEKAGESPGSHFILVVDHVDHEPLRIEAVETIAAGDDGVVRLERTLSAGLEFTGCVLRPDASGCAGACVRLSSVKATELPRTLRFGKKRRCDEGGAFRFRGLMADLYSVEIEADGLCPVRTEVDLRDGHDARGSIALAPGCSLEGRVVDAEGRPLPGEPVYVAAPDHHYLSVTTDAHGAFRFPSLPAHGAAKVRCGGQFEEDVPLPSQPLVIRLGQPIQICVRLVSAEDGAPLGPPAAVHLHGPAVDVELPVGPDGATATRAVLAATYSLYAEVPGRVTARVDVEVSIPGECRQIKIAVPRGGALAGRVVDASGAALAGVKVRAWGAGRHSRRDAVTDEAGRYRVPGLSGRCTVAFTAPEHAIRAFWGVAVQDAGRETALAVTMSRGGSVRGFVRSPSGEPLSGIVVRVLDRERNLVPYELPSTTTDASGAYRLNHVPAGWHIIAAGRQVADVEIADLNEARLDF